MLLWLADGVIESLDLNTKEFSTNVSGPGIMVRALALDRSVERVYYIGYEDQITALYCMDYKGGRQVKMFVAEQMKSVFGLGLHGGFLYWVNYAMSTDIVYKAPLRMDGSREVKMLQTIDKASATLLSSLTLFSVHTSVVTRENLIQLAYSSY